MPASAPVARSAEGRIKGAAFREFVLWYAARRGATDVARAVASIPDQFGLELDSGSRTLGIVTSKWYEAQLVHALLDALVGELPASERQALAMEGSAAVMQSTLSGVYRVLFRLMANPERYSRHAQKLFSAYYDTGRFDVKNLAPGRATCTVTEWKSHHPFICLLNWGAAKAIYRAMGCKNVTVERKDCVDRGGPHCFFVVTWSA